MGQDRPDRPVPPGQLQQPRDRIAVKPRPDHPAGIARDNRIGRNAPAHHGPRADDAARPDLGTGQHQGPLPDPDIMTDLRIGARAGHRGAAFTRTTEYGEGKGRKPVKAVIGRGREEGHAIGDLAEFAERQGLGAEILKIRGQMRGPIGGRAMRAGIGIIADAPAWMGDGRAQENRALMGTTPRQFDRVARAGSRKIGHDDGPRRSDVSVRVQIAGIVMAASPRLGWKYRQLHGQM